MFIGIFGLDLLYFSDDTSVAVPSDVERLLAKTTDAMLERKRQEIAEKMAKIHERVVLVSYPFCMFYP